MNEVSITDLSEDPYLRKIYQEYIKIRTKKVITLKLNKASFIHSR
jgi:hypothetical protein